MAQKCVHKGCGKVFTDENEECVYHPGPPVFHEGQKGWKCCKPRVLTFDEFMTIPPCTTGKHSTVDDTPVPEKKPEPEIPDIKPAASAESALPAAIPRLPQAQGQTTPKPPASPAPPEDDSDDPDAAVPENASCKRRGCGAGYKSGDRSEEECTYHPGQALFHEGSKGWTCCKRRVLEFDEFLRIPGCKTKKRHLFVGSKKAGGEEVLESVRHDFYQTHSTVIASIFLKKIDKEASKIAFSSATTVDLDLKTADNKRYKQQVPTYAGIDPEKSTFKVMGTKVELTLAKADATSWPVLRSDERVTGEIIQMGKAGRV